MSRRRAPAEAAPLAATDGTTSTERMVGGCSAPVFQYGAGHSLLAPQTRNIRACSTHFPMNMTHRLKCSNIGAIPTYLFRTSLFSSFRGICQSSQPTYLIVHIGFDIVIEQNFHLRVAKQFEVAFFAEAVHNGITVNEFVFTLKFYDFSTLRLTSPYQQNYLS